MKDLMINGDFSNVTIADKRLTNRIRDQSKVMQTDCKTLCTLILSILGLIELTKKADFVEETKKLMKAHDGTQQMDWSR